MRTKFELDADQQSRFDAWHKHHWDVVHKGWRPPDMSGFNYWLMFGPTGMGDNVKVTCAWCPEGHQGHVCDLTTDFDMGEFIVEYDENWNEIKR